MIFCNRYLNNVDAIAADVAEQFPGFGKGLRLSDRLVSSGNHVIKCLSLIVNSVLSLFTIVNVPTNLQCYTLLSPIPLSSARTEQIY